MQKATFLAAVGAVVFGFFLATTSGRAQNKTENQASASPFDGRVIAVSSKVGHGWTLQDPSVQRLDERSFIVGTYVVGRGDDGWGKDRRIWIALDEVIQIVEYASVDEWEAGLAPEVVAVAPEAPTPVFDTPRSTTRPGG